MAELISVPDVEIKAENVLRYLGYRPGQQVLPAAVAVLVREEIGRGARLAAPRAVLATWAVEAVTAETVILAGTGLRLKGIKIACHLRPAEKVTVFAVTLGPALEQQVAGLFAAGEYTRAVILDAVGSEGAEQAAEAVNRHINGTAAAAGCGTVFRFSPGYGDWDVRAQRELLAAVEAERIGLAAGESALLIPRKSVTAAVGWVRGKTGPAAPAGCRQCARTDCQYRRQRQEVEG